LSELIKWFEKRRETRALTIIQQHLALTESIVEDLERAFDAVMKSDTREMNVCIERVTNNEREADMLRRKVMDEVSKGDLPPTAREDIMHLVKRVDMVADWSREATRILSVLPIEELPKSIKEEALEMARGAKECTSLLRECMNKMMTKPEEALHAADAVERKEEKVDDLHERARRLLGKENMLRAGVAVLVGQLFEALEMIADSCEDACDQVRVIMVRR